MRFYLPAVNGRYAGSPNSGRACSVNIFLQTRLISTSFCSCRHDLYRKFRLQDDLWLPLSSVLAFTEHASENGASGKVKKKKKCSGHVSGVSGEDAGQRDDFFADTVHAGAAGAVQLDDDPSAREKKSKKKKKSQGSSLEKAAAVEGAPGESEAAGGNNKKKKDKKDKKLKKKRKSEELDASNTAAADGEAAPANKKAKNKSKKEKSSAGVIVMPCLCSHPNLCFWGFPPPPSYSVVKKNCRSHLNNQQQRRKPTV